MNWAELLRHDDVGGARGASAVHRRQGALADDDGVEELDDDVVGVGGCPAGSRHDQAPAPLERVGEVLRTVDERLSVEIRHRVGG